MKEKKEWKTVQEKLYNMVSIGVVNNKINQGYDIISTLMLIINIGVSIAMTYDAAMDSYGDILKIAEAVTVFFFAMGKSRAKPTTPKPPLSLPTIPRRRPHLSR